MYDSKKLDGQVKYINEFVEFATGKPLEFFHVELFDAETGHVDLFPVRTITRTRVALQHLSDVYGDFSLSFDFGFNHIVRGVMKVRNSDNELTNHVLIFFDKR